MSLFKKILTAIVIILLAMQFIRPDRNIDNQASSTDISGVFSVPDSVKVILQNACYDCHSNNTRYPWYVNIQPAGSVSYTHLRAHETRHDLVCRLLLEK